MKPAMRPGMTGQLRLLGDDLDEDRDEAQDEAWEGVNGGDVHGTTTIGCTFFKHK